MSYANRAKAGKKGRGRGRGRLETVDARQIVRVFEEGNGGGDENDSGGGGYIWAENIVVNSVVICRMGAQKSEDPMLGLVYPPVGEKVIFDHVDHSST